MKIAITGTIGSGKSTVASYLRNKGYFVFDCDEVNRELLNSDVLIDYFPECYDDGLLDKKKLANIVFNDEKKRLLLESIMHPLILERMEEESGKHEPFFAEVPLLFEVNWDKYFDEILLVVVDEKIALERLVDRGLSIEESKQRIKNQMSIKEKIERSDVIIYNDSSLFSLYEKIDRWLSKNAWK